MKTQLSILAVCLAAGCAHGKGTETAKHEQHDRTADVHESTHAQSHGKAPGEAPVAQRTPEAKQTPESPSDAQAERVEIPSARRNDQLASRGDVPAPASDYDTDAANTGVNERDRNDQALTPLDQGGSTGDREITQRIRKAVVSNDDLSFTAKNVKIITRDGQVTLRGAVKSAQERTSIERAAKTVAGPSKVVNELEVTKD